MPEKLVMVIDVLGFQEIMRNVPADVRLQRIGDWLRLANAPGRTFNLESQLVSDTLFVVADPTDEGITKLVELGSYLLEQGLNRNLPLRGAIARGDVEQASQSLWGPAIIDAYVLGQATDWIGIALDASVKPIPAALYAKRLAVYPTPAKSGPIQMRSNIRWSIPNASSLAALTTGGFLAKPNETLGWSWHKKLENTSDFRTYLQVLDGANYSGDVFVGDVGPHLVALFVEWALKELSDKWPAQLRSWNHRAIGEPETDATSASSPQASK